jgi:hypothetical protein
MQLFLRIFPLVAAAVPQRIGHTGEGHRFVRCAGCARRGEVHLPVDSRMLPFHGPVKTTSSSPETEKTCLRVAEIDPWAL